jgi:hypothetical protein
MTRDALDEIKGISLLFCLLMVRMELKLTKQRQEPLSLIASFNLTATVRVTSFSRKGRPSRAWMFNGMGHCGMCKGVGSNEVG